VEQQCDLKPFTVLGDNLQYHYQTGSDTVHIYIEKDELKGSILIDGMLMEEDGVITSLDTHPTTEADISSNEIIYTKDVEYRDSNMHVDLSLERFIITFALGSICRVKIPGLKFIKMHGSYNDASARFLIDYAFEKKGIAIVENSRDSVCVLTDTESS
jgi:hypothetical protein